MESSGMGCSRSGSHSPFETVEDVDACALGVAGDTLTPVEIVEDVEVSALGVAGERHTPVETVEDVEVSALLAAGRAGSWGGVDIADVADVSPAAGSARVPPPGEFGEDGEDLPLSGGLGLYQSGTGASAGRRCRVQSAEGRKVRRPCSSAVPSVRVRGVELEPASGGCCGVELGLEFESELESEFMAEKKVGFRRFR